MLLISNFNFGRIIMSTNTEPIVPSSKEVALAEKSSRILSDIIKENKTAILQFVDAKRTKKINIPPLAVQILVDILEEMGQGNAISVTPIPTELTTKQAANFLNVSHPFFMNLLDEGKIRSRKVGTKYRVLAKDVIRYKTTMKKKRLKTLETLTRQAQKLKMGYE
jgi:excisionase family DNA binding protein